MKLNREYLYVIVLKSGAPFVAKAGKPSNGSRCVRVRVTLAEEGKGK